MLFPIALVVWLYLTARVIYPLPIGFWRIVLSLALLLVLRHHYIWYLLWGSIFSPEIPRLAIIVVNWLFGAAVVLTVLRFAADLVALAVAAALWRRPASSASLRVLLPILAASVSGYAVSSAVVVPDVKDVEVGIKDLPPAFEGFRVVQLTDLHISRMFNAPWVAEVVARVSALEPDVILATGDLVDGTVTARLSDVAPLSGLRARHGVFHVPGNHEYYFGYDEWMARFSELGFQPPLLNRHHVIRIGEDQLVIAGVADTEAARRNLPPPDLAGALAGSPDAPVVLLQHRPRGARSNAQSGVDLQLSGHTHGGMIVGFDRLVARANDGFASGAYKLDDMTLYVSNGTALWAGFAFRVLRPPEITQITLRRE
jgi:uncharacterized protein